MTRVRQSRPLRDPCRVDRRSATMRRVERTGKLLIVVPLAAFVAFVIQAAWQPRDARTAVRVVHACVVTTAQRATRPPTSVPASFNYGNARIAVALSPPSGRLIAGRLPSGGYRAVIRKDGSINAKYGWWRSRARPKLRISGRRLDAPAPPLRASIPDGYDRGFQATGVIFPTSGCWRVTGSVGTATLTFTVLVSKSRLGQ
jgi:hypothetical protein